VDNGVNEGDENCVDNEGDENCVDNEVEEFEDGMLDLYEGHIGNKGNL
jgi:hypothetical protein